ncbi:TatD family hydrolase [Vibrio sp. Y2-5]|uniref:TatD family hydrolase n=1 Tax=Vibrio sp. Y2-5 TaxID=2743977 RepID=UPI001CB6DB89|nr:TatD family hydrolase [Vibrio sp. Y2-5]
MIKPQLMTKTATRHKLRLFDTHCHFDFDEFAASFSEQMSAATQAHVEKIIIPSVGLSNWLRVKNLATQYPVTLRYALGFHPYFLEHFSDEQLQLLEDELSQRESACVAVGECGLDAMVAVDASLQERVFIAQLAMAQHAHLPLILHSRKTHNRLLQLIKQHRFTQGGVLHAFSGSEQQARQFIDLGFKIGVGGVITYPRANKTRQAISQLPIESLVLETDAPDMPLFGRQGEANHPKYLIHVLEELAVLRDTNKEKLASQLWANSIELFRIDE